MNILANKISSIMAKYERAVDMRDSVEQVEHFMVMKGLSSVPVVNSLTRSTHAECIGMIDAKALARVRELKKDPKTTLAWQICSRKPATTGADTPVVEVAQMMFENELDLVVVTENHCIAGFVSALDVLNAISSNGCESRRADAIPTSAAASGGQALRGRGGSR